MDNVDEDAEGLGLRHHSQAQRPEEVHPLAIPHLRREQGGGGRLSGWGRHLGVPRGKGAEHMAEPGLEGATVPMAGKGAGQVHLDLPGPVQGHGGGGLGVYNGPQGHGIRVVLGSAPAPQRPAPGETWR